MQEEKYYIEIESYIKRNELIKKWSKEFSKKYGGGYDVSNLKRFRQFFILFPKGGTLCHLSWSQLRTILPIKKNKILT